MGAAAGGVGAAAGGVGAPVPCGLALHCLAAMPAAAGAAGARGAGAAALIFAAGRDGGLHGYDASGERSVSLAGAHADRVWSLAALPASTTASTQPALLASGSADCCVRLWRLTSPPGGGAPSLEQWAPLLDHAAPVHAVMPHGDGRLLASGSEDGALRLWDLGAHASGAHALRGVCAPPPHAPSIPSAQLIRIEPASKRVASASPLAAQTTSPPAPTHSAVVV